MDDDDRADHDITTPAASPGGPSRDTVQRLLRDTAPDDATGTDLADLSALYSSIKDLLAALDYLDDLPDDLPDDARRDLGQTRTLLIKSAAAIEDTAAERLTDDA